MPTIDPTRTLAELVTAHPGSAAVLDRLGLDYCCGGNRSVADAARHKGMPIDDVVAALQSVPVGPPAAGWTDLGVAALVDHIESTHHAYLDDALPRLDALATKVADAHGARHPELHQVGRLVAELRAELEPHLREEERVLFPMVRELAGAASRPPFRGSLRTPISVLRSEHDRAGELLAALRATTSAFRIPDDGCASYRALYAGLSDLESDTHQHVHKENNVLFPAVLAAEDRLPAQP